MGLDKIFFHVQKLFSFCKFCFDGEDGSCDNEAYIAPFRNVNKNL